MLHLVLQKIKQLMPRKFFADISEFEALMDGIVDSAKSQSEAYYYWEVRAAILSAEVCFDRISVHAGDAYRHKISLIRSKQIRLLDEKLVRNEIDLTAYQIELDRLDIQYPPTPLNTWRAAVGL